MLLLSIIPIVVALIAALVAAVTDLWRFRIYNALTLPLLASGLIFQSFAVGGTGFVPSLVGVLLGSVPMLLLYLSGGLGAGDVKLMAGLGAWLGPAMTVQVLLASWLAAGVYAVGVLLYNAATAHRSRVRFRLQNLTQRQADEQLAQVIAQPNRRQRLIPFGAMILAGVVAAMISTGNIR